MQPAAVTVSPTPRDLSSRLAWWLVLVLVLCALSKALVRMPFNLLVDPLRAAFALSDTQFSLLQGYAFSLPFLLAAPLWGLASDRYSRQRLLAGAMALVGAGAIGLALATAYWQLLLWRGVVGLGSAALFPIAITLITDRFDPQLHGRALGLFYAGVGLSPGLGAFGTGVLYDLAGGFSPQALPVVLAPWQLTFLCVGLLPVLCTLLLFTVATPPRQRSLSVPGARVAESPQPAHATAGMTLLVTVFAALALMSLLDEANLSWLAAVYTRVHGYTQRQAGDVLGLIALAGGGVGPVVGGWLADRVYARHGLPGRLALCLGACACATPLLLVYLQGSALLLTAALAASAFFLTAALTVGMVVMQQALPPRIKGLGTGLLYSAIGVVAGSGATLVALVTDRVFADPQELPSSLAGVTVCLGTLACLCWTLALLRARQARPATR
jgi:MFS family permease